MRVLFCAWNFTKNKNNILKKIKKNCKLITTKLNPGDVLIHHCLMVHGIMKIKVKEIEEVLQFSLKDKKSDYDKKLLKNYENKLKLQMKLRKQI